MSSTPAGTESAERVADVLLAFVGKEGSLGVSEIARQLDLSKAVVHRILQSLVFRSLLQYSTKSREYQLGPASVALGIQALRRLDLRTLARIPLMELRESTGETTTLSLLSGDKRIYIDQYESPHEVKMTVELGRMHPLHAGASSRAILAFLPEEFVTRVTIAGLAATTFMTITDPDALRANLQRVRELGYSRSERERQKDAGSVAAPLFGPHGEVIGCISVCGPSARLDDAAVARYAPLVTSTAERITALVSEP